VEPERVCTEARCAALGPRLRAAIKVVDPSDQHATTAHAPRLSTDAGSSTRFMF